MLVSRFHLLLRKACVDLLTALKPHNLFIILFFYVLCCSIVASCGNGAAHEQQPPFSLENIRTLKQEGKYNRAVALVESLEQHLQQAETSAERLIHASLLQELSELLTLMGQPEAATEKAMQALAIRQALQGPAHPDIGRALTALALAYEAQGNYTQALAMHVRSLPMLSQGVGERHPDVARALNSMATNYQALGNFSQASALHDRALAIRLEALGEGHPDVAASYNNIAALQAAMGNYSAAVTYYEQGLQIFLNAFGQQHPYVASLYNNLANAHRALGNFDKALPLHQQALALRKQMFGEIHLDVASSENNLGAVFMNMQRPKLALDHFKRALRIREHLLGDKHPIIGSSYTNIAAALQREGRIGDAIYFQKKAIRIIEESLSAQHPDYVTALSNLAIMQTLAGDYDSAIVYAKSAILTAQQALGPKHPLLATCYHNIASIHASYGHTTEAMRYYATALNMRRELFGDAHPDVADTMASMALTSWKQQNMERALLYFQEANNILSRHIRQVIGGLGGPEKHRFQAAVRAPYAGYLTIATQKYSLHPTTIRTAYDLVLQRKGLALSMEQLYQKAILANNGKAALLFESLSQLRNEISRLIYSSNLNLNSAHYQATLEKLEGECTLLETKLSQMSASYAAQSRAINTKTTNVISALPSHSLLIEFVKIPSLSGITSSEYHCEDRYIAFIVENSENNAIRLIDLGCAAPLEKQVQAFKSAVLSGRVDDHFRKTSTSLFKALIEPLGIQATKYSRIYCVPDGILYTLPLETIMRPNGNYLIEEAEFIYLNAGRDIVSLASANDSPDEHDKRVVAFGAPDYDGDLNEQLEHNASTTGALFTFPPLPGTKEEIKSIQRVFGDAVDAFTGILASRKNFLRLQAPSILHIATHGFFLPPRFTDVAAATTPFSRRTTSPTQLVKGIFDNPLRRTGLALSGANHFGQRANNDGVVTAEDVLRLDLSTTELVVLSACETGLGDVYVGEGVFGLQRSFIRAGAKCIVISMWKVLDEETANFMAEFYTKLTLGENPVSAQRKTAMEILARLRKGNRSVSPIYWGGFIVVMAPHTR